MIKNSFKTILFTLSIALMPFLINGQASISEGKSLFKTNCASCHAKNMKSKATGPALGGAVERWTADYPLEDLYEWVRNSQALVAAGHPKAVALFNEWNSVMQAAPHLDDQMIESIFLYVDDVFVNGPGGGNNTTTTGSVTEAKSTPTWFYYALFAILAVLALILARITSNLNYIAAAKEGATGYTRKTLWQTLTSKSVIGFALFIAVLLGGYTTVNNATALGRQEGYAPEQPIAFSHATHAGLNQIDCQYCHDGARRSKHSIIPAANTCMNCHRAITVGTKHGTAEITKIFASIGFDQLTISI